MQKTKVQFVLLAAVRREVEKGALFYTPDAEDISGVIHQNL